MASPVNEGPGPDLTQGVTPADFAGKAMPRSHAGKKSALLMRLSDKVLAAGAKCTHPQGPLDQGLAMGEMLRCPLRHDCFSLRTGKAPGAPAVAPVPCWKVGHRGERILMRERIAAPGAPPAALQPDQPREIVIIGGGAAGFAQATVLATDRGILAAGDAARGPGGAAMRARHRVAAERRGRAGAEDMPGAGGPFRHVPFFRSAHCATAIRHVGRAEAWGAVAIGGGIAACDASARHCKEGRTLAAATIGRDIAVLERGQPLAGLAR
ncbi:MAG TPA: Rieske 2Fe-2S domain-containing protein [Paracoccus sp. (in: a-proteobacteria)]|nr:Rieske 2Fe-2S domain-containing protein [Paracoccus sp. (in: a-proteobacteria)]